MQVSPYMDGRNIDCDSKGVVTITPSLILAYVVAGAAGLLGIGALVNGDIFWGIVGIIAGVITVLLAKSRGTSLELNPQTRILKIETGPRVVNIPFDDITCFGVATQKETGNFTEERIIAVLKDGSGIQLGVITDANEKARKEKVAVTMEYLHKKTGIVLNVAEGSNQG